jgi:tripartite-type tricarboxylate transporter receptor subunit TctC
VADHQGGEHQPGTDAMKLVRREFLHLAGAAATIAAISQSAWSQSYLTQPITMVVPYPAGGPTDAVARILAEGLRAPLGRPMVIENVSGAGAASGCAGWHGRRPMAMPLASVS